MMQYSYISIFFDFFGSKIAFFAQKRKKIRKYARFFPFFSFLARPVPSIWMNQLRVKENSGYGERTLQIKESLTISMMI